MSACKKIKKQIVCTINVLILKFMLGSQTFVYSSDLNITVQINSEKMSQW